MARVLAHQALMPSILDRLIDPDSIGTPSRPGYSPEQVMAVVRRDLENLLNSHQSCSSVVSYFPEVADSIVAYGLPDLVSIAATTASQREEIARLLESVIARFEPRLRDIHATLEEDPTGGPRMLRYRIDARLRLDPAPDVAFDTLLELTTGRYSVKHRDL